MNLPQYQQLEIPHLNRLFDKTSECYKFFWFQAIIKKVLAGKESISYDELIDEMVAEAWYMVTEYHLNLGPRDTLEQLICYIYKQSGMKSAEKEETILSYLKQCDDKEVLRLKRTLTYHVPYRLQAPFMSGLKGNEWNVSESKLIAKINQQERLMYYFTSLDGLRTQILVQPEWIDYIHIHGQILQGWLQYHMIEYLQRRNPNVPGIVDKLKPPQERKMEKVKKYWKQVIQLSSVHEIYRNTEITTEDMSIDHFVPWSFVAHDEFWNLHPTTRGINSSKSNLLPDWNIYFPKLCELEYFSYEMMYQYDAVRELFEKCAKEHLNSEEIKYRLYRENLSYEEFSGVLEEVISPVYQSAKNCGFEQWLQEEPYAPKND